MANPQAAVNLQRFQDFVAKRNAECDWEDYVLADRLDLNKQAIARECEFDRKRITGNKAILELYNACKSDLLQKGILVSDTRSASERVTQGVSEKSSAMDRRALKNAQESRAAVEEELFQVKRQLHEANTKLERLQKIEDYMLSTGRL